MQGQPQRTNIKVLKFRTNQENKHDGSTAMIFFFMSKVYSKGTKGCNP
jgi:hypothetical protein